MFRKPLTHQIAFSKRLLLLDLPLGIRSRSHKQSFLSHELSCFPGIASKTLKQISPRPLLIDGLLNSPCSRISTLSLFRPSNKDCPRSKHNNTITQRLGAAQQIFITQLSNELKKELGFNTTQNTESGRLFAWKKTICWTNSCTHLAKPAKIQFTDTMELKAQRKFASGQNIKKLHSIFLPSSLIVENDPFTDRIEFFLNPSKYFIHLSTFSHNKKQFFKFFALFCARFFLNTSRL